MKVFSHGTCPLIYQVQDSGVKTRLQTPNSVSSYGAIETKDFFCRFPLTFFHPPVVLCPYARYGEGKRCVE